MQARSKPDRELTISEPQLGSEEMAALCNVVESGWITMGGTVKRFEDEFARAHRVDRAIAVSSATAGLHLSLAALDVGAGDEVLVPSLTFVATVNAILYTGATPVLVDIESPVRPHLCIERAKDKLTSRTRAVVVVHYGGWMCPMDAWRTFADEHGLILIEDAAHAPGLWGCSPRGDTAVFSFYGNKNMTTAEGGMVLAGNAENALRIQRMRSHGMTTLTLDRYDGHAFSYDVTDLGFNYRMDELRAAVGLVQLEKLPAWNKRRVELLNRYRNALNNRDSEVRIPFEISEPTTAHLCPVVLPANVEREQTMERLRREGIHSSIHYPPVHQFSYHRARLGEQYLPNTDQYASRELSLPLHPGLSERDVDYVVEHFMESIG